MILSCCCFKTIILNDILAPIFREVILALVRLPLPFVAGKCFFLFYIQNAERDIYIRFSACFMNTLLVLTILKFH